MDVRREKIQPYFTASHLPPRCLLPPPPQDCVAEKYLLSFSSPFFLEQRRSIEEPQRKRYEHKFYSDIPGCTAQALSRKKGGRSVTCLSHPSPPKNHVSADGMHALLLKLVYKAAGSLSSPPVSSSSFLTVSSHLVKSASLDLLPSTSPPL